MADIFDLSRSPIPIGPAFRSVRYNGRQIPGGDADLSLGANCQVYAYAFLRSLGYDVPDLRSSELWEDTAYSTSADPGDALSIVLVNSEPVAYGAHTGVALGEGLILHLAKHHGVPAIETLDSLMATPRYRHLIGAKRFFLAEEKLRSFP